MSEIEAYPNRFCPCCSKFVVGSFNPGPGGRPDASCPHCGSLERQRFLALLLSSLATTVPPIGTLLDIAPTVLVTPMLDQLAAQHRIRLDLGADPRMVDCYASLTELPLADDSVDFLMCYHVLEHVPDDRKAMRELARVLSPGGIGLMQVPWKPDSDTDEDPSAPEAERLRRFGQGDHVRWYGRDLEQRLLDSGLSVTRVWPRLFLGQAVCDLLRLNPVEMVWILSADDAPYLALGRDGEPTGLVRMLEAFVLRMGKERTQRDRARARIGRLKAKVERQRAQLDRAPRSLARRIAGRVRRTLG